MYLNVHFHQYLLTFKNKPGTFKHRCLDGWKTFLQTLRRPVLTFIDCPVSEPSEWKLDAAKTGGWDIKLRCYFIILTKL